MNRQNVEIPVYFERSEPAEAARSAVDAGEAERIYFFFLLRAVENRQFQFKSMYWILCSIFAATYFLVKTK